MKKIFGLAAVVSMVAVANVCMSSNNNEEVTALQLENIEYLAEAENLAYQGICTYNPIKGYCSMNNHWANSYCPRYACFE